MSLAKFQEILIYLTDANAGPPPLPLFVPTEQFHPRATDDARRAASLNAAFVMALTGNRHPDFARATDFLRRQVDDTALRTMAAFYRRGLRLIREEIQRESRRDPQLARDIDSLHRFLTNMPADVSADDMTEQLWSLFFPEAVGIRGHEPEQIQRLREKRKVRITQLNREPLRYPAREILFTANVLLTLPPDDRGIDAADFPAAFKAKLKAVRNEPQAYWYDHPIPMGIPPEQNEVIYGLRHLDRAMEEEMKRGNLKPGERVVCLLSVSVTHRGLQPLAAPYLRGEIGKAGGFSHLDIYLFTEEDTARLVSDVLEPAASRFGRTNAAVALRAIFGVDGEYGRHYSFLKAIAAFWQILVDPAVRATFKIDLDQVFPQQRLLAETGLSALEHFKTELWGARGIDSQGNPLELGMIAGALVNERDIARSLFIPDVPFPEQPPRGDELIFFSRLPQALSTRAEMMARYDSPELDGRTSCLQRVHVTGGTNGILIDALRRHRPFTPTFIGRAEDQAYILSVFSHGGPRLAYLHQPGLMMRHDKNSFARQAIDSARIGKLVGDYVRILYFSAYARLLSGDIRRIKEFADPFTGCFISRIPVTVTYLRFALKAASFFRDGEWEDGRDFIRIGTRRLMTALDFTRGEPAEMEEQFRREKAGWDAYYDLLRELEQGIAGEHPAALSLKKIAARIIGGCKM